MRVRSVSVLLAALAAAIGLVALAPAAARAADLVTATIPFSFTAGNAVLPAGDYRMKVDWNDQLVIIQDLTSGRQTPAPLLTTLARAPKGNPEPRVVFDELKDGTHVLSEVWLGDFDGALVGATKGMHEHRTINLKG